jgi:leucyl-tRNA synthetase
MSAKRTPPTITGNDPESKIPAFRYTSNLANQVESKWQDHWEDEGTF